MLKDIEKGHAISESITINNKFDKDFLFYILSINGLLLYVGTNLYISFIADYQLFVWHPILMSFMILSSTQGVIILQKAVKKHEKAQSFLYHKWMQLFSLSCLIAGFIIVYYNKTIKNKTHYKTYHAKIGLITFTSYIIQSVAGLAIIYFPSLLGRISKYRYHRFIGYVILSLIWLSAITSTQAHWTTINFNQNWIWMFSIGIIFISIIGRINLSKIRIW